MPLESRGIIAGPRLPVVATSKDGSPFPVFTPEDSTITTVSNPMLPGEFVYEFLQRTSGPQSASGNDWDLDTVSNVTPSVFEYQVPVGAKSFSFNRINIELVDNAMQANRFGGVGALANGCLLQIVDDDGITILHHFGTDIQPLQQNSNFTVLAGVDAVVTFLAGDDMLPIRFSVFKAGAPMELIVGQRIRWTNRDDISGLTIFRIMAQGTLEL